MKVLEKGPEEEVVVEEAEVVVEEAEKKEEDDTGDNDDYEKEEQCPPALAQEHRYNLLGQANRAEREMENLGTWQGHGTGQLALCAACPPMGTPRYRSQAKLKT